MKLHLRILAVLSLTLLLLSPTVFANLGQGIQKFIKKIGHPIHIGIIIRKAKTGKILYKFHSNYLYAPASVQKLLTATAALKYLGPNFTYKTRLFVKGSQSNHVFRGDVLIKFSGDPELGLDDLQELIEVLKNQSITKIQGHVYIDASTYDNIYYPPGWLWDDLSYSYAAPLSAVIIDKNKFILRLTPSKILGRHPSLATDIPDNIIKFRNHVITTAHINDNCPLTIYSDASNHFTLNGCLNKDWGRRRRNLAVRDPLPYAKALILQALEDDNIFYRGKITISHSTKQYNLLNEHKSAPLRKLLKDMLKKSDNLITDSLLKQIGHKYFQKPGSWRNGILALKKILSDTKIDFKKNLIDDGAGLSRYNLLTPNQLSQLLQYIYLHPSMRHILVEALPIGGIDGTLVERMFSEAKEKRIHAKTGSMTGVTSLAGFIYSRHLGVLSFAIMINGFIGKHTPYNRLEDRICEYLAHYHRGKKHG